MVLKWEKATNEQLLTITHFEDCPTIIKHMAAVELKKREEIRYTKNCARKYAGRRTK
jgi:hypothetical protein